MDIQRSDLKKQKQRKQIMIGGIAAAVVLLGTLGLSRLEPAAPSVERSSVWLDTVKRGEMLREVRGPGTLVPKEIRWIAAETNVRVERILVKPGAKVEPDYRHPRALHPEVDDQRLTAESQVAAARADLTAKKVSLESAVLDQRANLAGVVADAETARLRAEAEKGLNQKGVVSTLQYKESQLKADRLTQRESIEKDRLAKLDENMKAQLQAEASRLAQLENTLKLRQRRADALKVKAGIEGVLQQVPVEEGQQLQAGANLARVAKPDVLMAELQIAETQAKDIRAAQTVKVDTRSGSGGVIPGHVGARRPGRCETERCRSTSNSTPRSPTARAPTSAWTA
jgi:HlyD family secretion protein